MNLYEVIFNVTVEYAEQEDSITYESREFAVVADNGTDATEAAEHIFLEEFAEQAQDVENGSDSEVVSVETDVRYLSLVRRVDGILTAETGDEE